MSADVLREAARLMRETAAEAEATGVWEWRSKNGAVYFPQNTRVGRYIQSWQPGASLAVADWLDGVAAWDLADLLMTESFVGPSADTAKAALAVARAYLNPGG